MKNERTAVMGSRASQNIIDGTNHYICMGLEYFLMFLILIDGNSVYRNVTGVSNLTVRISISTITVGLILFLILLLHSRENLMVLRNAALTICAVFVFGVVFLYFNAVKTTVVNIYILLFLLFLPLMMALFAIYQRMGKPYQLFYRLEDLVLILAIASLILWIFSTVLGLLEPTGSIPIAWGDAKKIDHYYYLLMERKSQSEYLKVIDGKIIRNIGIFPESPMYNIFLNTALYTEFFLKERQSKIRISVFLLTILSTFGTIGIIIAMGGCYFKFVQCNYQKPTMRKVIFAVTGLAFFCVIVLLLNKRANGWGSYATHIDDYLASLKAWKTAPVFGTGFNNVKVIQSFMSDFRKHNQGLSNSIAVVLAQGGIVLFSFYLLPFVLLIYRAVVQKNAGLFFWTLGLFGIYFTTIFHYRMFLLAVLAFGMQFLDLQRMVADDGLLSKVSLWMERWGDEWILLFSAIYVTIVCDRLGIRNFDSLIITFLLILTSGFLLYSMIDRGIIAANINVVFYIAVLLLNEGVTQARGTAICLSEFLSIQKMFSLGGEALENMEVTGAILFLIAVLAAWLLLTWYFYLFFLYGKGEKNRKKYRRVCSVIITVLLCLILNVYGVPDSEEHSRELAAKEAIREFGLVGNIWREYQESEREGNTSP